MIIANLWEIVIHIQFITKNTPFGLFRQLGTIKKENSFYHNIITYGAFMTTRNEKMRYQDQRYLSIKFGILVFSVMLPLLFTSCNILGKDENNASLDTVVVVDTLIVVDTTHIKEDPKEIIQDIGDFYVRIYSSQIFTDEFTNGLSMGASEFASELNSYFKLPHGNINVDWKDCNQANAYYSFPPATITMCYELLVELMFNFDLSPDPIEYAFLAFEWIFNHELGHALVHQLDLPIIGNEETVADAIATIFTLSGPEPDGRGAILGAYYLSNSTSPWYDTHQPGPQRLGNVVCWVVGGDPFSLLDQTINSMAQELYNSGRDCEAEYNQQKSSIDKLLEPYLKQPL